MKVIICGAGQVGSNIARYLATDGNDVSVIDQERSLIERLQDTLDVQGFVGHASLPDVLERAGARDADLLIAVTYSDEVNIVACEVAHALFDIPTKIARVRQQEYLKPMWADLFTRANVPIDAVISPEIEVANAIMHRLELPGAFDAIPLSDGKVTLMGVRCGADCPVVNTPLRQLSALFPDLHITVFGIIRNERKIIASADDQMEVGDEVYVVSETSHLRRALSAFGHEEAVARRLIIVGGGNIGLHLAERLEAEHPNVDVKLIELDRARASLVAERVKRTVVLQGDALDTDILREANVKSAETFIAVTNDDEVNILSSLLAKQHGCKGAITLINKPTYSSLVGPLAIDAFVSPRAITVSTILQHVRRGRVRSVHTLREDFGEIIEVDALETSRLVGVPLREADLPDGVIVGALMRGNDVFIPRGETVIRPHDRVILFAATEAVKEVERLFSVRLEFF